MDREPQRFEGMTRVLCILLFIWALFNLFVQPASSGETMPVERALLHWIRSAPNHPLSIAGYRGEVASAIVNGSSAHGLPAELVTAIVLRESSGRFNARDSVGAFGLMQVSPDRVAYYSCNMATPDGQIDCGCRILAHQYARCGTLRGAVSAYASKLGLCVPIKGTNLARVVNDRFRFAFELSQIMRGKKIEAF